ncbi:hypothetical protein ZIOFF_018978 [Zingiber officinale]|uniref:Exostosin GT47 domain-containing protein n=1 Tax=Zingiber officinale TaxID=94328 RepID=A0A8J5HDN3_ZINOF|nr:hypothetical protein ZIOFF_018978 [Zingiber officinale]
MSCGICRSDMWQWQQEEECCLSTYSQFALPLWDDTMGNQTPLRGFGDFDLDKLDFGDEVEKGVEEANEASRVKRRRVLNFFSDVDGATVVNEHLSSELLQEKDIIAPYKHLITTFINDSSGFDGRPTLLYFQGGDAFFKILSQYRCPSSNRLFDAIASHCVPVIISDDIELPYEDVLDYSNFCIFVPTSNATGKGFLIDLLRSVSQQDWTRMWKRLKEVEGYFEYQYPSKKDDAVQMI